MDGYRFDRLTRAFAGGKSRRQVVRLLLGGAALGARPLAVAAQAASCDAGLTDCGGVCVDLLTDLGNCGGCDAVCESELVPVECRAGACVRANCPAGVTYCGAVDGCRDLSSDPAHCGACGQACASGVCSGGACDAGGGACAPGQVECDGVCVDTCCNNEHCGACGNACPSGTSCFEGICDCPSGLCCAEGEVICGDACVATCCDNNNCGACGNVCAQGLTCFEGVCDCPSGDCPPTEPPHTGSGVASGMDPWPAAALAGAAVAAGAAWRTRERANSDA